MSVIGFDFGISQALSKLVYDLPNSRKQELEGMEAMWHVQPNIAYTYVADAIGIKLAAQACYDPRAAPE